MMSSILLPSRLRSLGRDGGPEPRRAPRRDQSRTSVPRRRGPLERVGHRRSGGHGQGFGGTPHRAEVSSRRGVYGITTGVGANREQTVEVRSGTDVINLTSDVLRREPSPRPRFCQGRPRRDRRPRRRHHRHRGVRTGQRSLPSTRTAKRSPGAPFLEHACSWYPEVILSLDTWRTEVTQAAAPVDWTWSTTPRPAAPHDASSRWAIPSWRRCPARTSWGRAWTGRRANGSRGACRRRHCRLARRHRLPHPRRPGGGPSGARRPHRDGAARGLTPPPSQYTNQTCLDHGCGGPDFRAFRRSAMAPTRQPSALRRRLRGGRRPAASGRRPRPRRPHGPTRPPAFRSTRR